MITIKIRNAPEIVSREKGRFLGWIARRFLDCERLVEEEILRQLQEVFARKNIQAELEIVSDSSKPRASSRKLKVLNGQGEADSEGREFRVPSDGAARAVSPGSRK